MARGSIYPRTLANGSTVYDVRYRTSNGVPKQKRGFRKPREAERFLNEQLVAADRGELVESRSELAIRRRKAYGRPKPDGD